MRLTARFVKHAPIGWHCDGRGLYVQCAASADGSICRSWVYRFVINGRQRYMGLGPVADISLAQAREKAADARKLRLEGIDPLEVRRAQRTAARLEAAKAMSFGQCVEAYLQAHEASWRNEKHRAQWRMTLTEYCKAISDLPVQAIDTDLVLKVLTPLWKTRTETASRLRGRIERVLAWAKGRNLRDGDNPARWSGHLKEMLAAPAKIAAVQHHAALPYVQIPAFMAELRKRDSLAARALEFCILCASRTNEVIGAQWSEINFDAKCWTIPASRMKGGREHRVPLCDRAINILRSLDYNHDYNARIFSLSDWSLREVQRELAPNASVHGMRSSFRDWAAERTNYANHIVEMALAHVIPNAVEAAYRRGDLYLKRTKLMASWGEYCGKTFSTISTPISFQRCT